MSQRWKGGSSQRSKAGPSSNKPCANPIFERWIMEWKEEAETKDSKMKYVYAKALNSLRKYPLALSSGKECSILENFGSHMCKMIENRMVKEHMIPEVSHLTTSQSLSEVIALDDEVPGPSYRVTASKKKTNTATVKDKKLVAHADSEDLMEIGSEPIPSTSTTKPKQRQGKQYLPAYRSGAYAILIALLKKEAEAGYRGYMTKSELQQDAQRYCDSSLTKPDSTKNSHYTSWNSMKVLTSKELLMKRGNPVQFFLTPDGRSLAKRLSDAESKDSQQQQGGIEDPASEYDASSQDEDCEVVNSNVPSGVRLEPGKFEIVLYVDTCETTGRSKSQDVINELQKNGVTIYVHRLNIGDFVWVCREVADVTGNRNRLTMSRTNELILPYVVERRRTDDLAGSIKDGRFHEQKFRLTQTKLQPIYLIESYGKGDFGLAEGALDRAICNTQIENGFLIQETSSIKETCAYLTFMTRHLKTTYEHKTINGFRKPDWPNLKDHVTETDAPLMFFSDFNDFSVKKMNWKVKEMLARHLMRLKGLSVDKAYAIIQKYPTVDHLLRAYSNCDNEKQKENLLSHIEFGTSCRKIGPSISRKISRLYNTTILS